MERRSLVFIAAAILGVISLTTFADNGSPSPTAGVKQPPQPLTVGGLAKLVVAEVAVNSPKGGFDERFSLGVMGAVGFDATRSPDAPATLADLKAMLSVFDVETSTQNPQEALTVSRVTQTLNSVRSTLPHFAVPVSGKHAAANATDPTPGPCLIAFFACKAKCRTMSFSGTGGTLFGCFSECNLALTKCCRTTGSCV